MKFRRTLRACHDEGKRDGANPRILPRQAYFDDDYEKWAYRAGFEEGRSEWNRLVVDLKRTFEGDEQDNP